MKFNQKNKKVAWVLSLITVLAGSVVASALYSRAVYTSFIWKYLWGPVVADAYGVRVVSRANGSVEIGSIISQTAVTAEPGYTTVSTLVYALLLIFFVLGIVIFSRDFGLKLNLDLFVGLLPFIFLGGLLRVVEDINTVLYQSTGEFMIPYPYSTLLISPIIYALVFVISVVSVYISVRAEQKSITEDSTRLLVSLGLTACGLVLVVISATVVQQRIIEFNYVAFIVSLLLSIGISAVAYYSVKSLRPSIHNGTGKTGVMVIFAHTLDGVVNVLGLDWSDSIGIAVEYTPKHVLNSFVRNITGLIQPTAVTELIGVTWPFLLLKVGISLFLLWTFDEKFKKDDTKLFVLLLLAATAVGLGPGTRDLTRMVLGI